MCETIITTHLRGYEPFKVVIDDLWSEMSAHTLTTAIERYGRTPFHPAEISMDRHQQMYVMSILWNKFFGFGFKKTLSEFKKRKLETPMIEFQNEQPTQTSQQIIQKFKGNENPPSEFNCLQLLRKISNTGFSVGCF